VRIERLANSETVETMFCRVSLDCTFSHRPGSYIGEFRTDLGLLARQAEEWWENRVRCAVGAAHNLEYMFLVDF
jgi:hypothetical protein